MYENNLGGKNYNIGKDCFIERVITVKKFTVLYANIARDLSILVIGTVIAQFIPILLQPFLKRIYTPEDFGAFDLYLKSLNILFVFFSLRYDVGIVLPKKEKEVNALINTSVMFSIFFLVISEIILLTFSDHIINIIKFPVKYRIFLYLLPITTFFFSINNTLNYYFIRIKAFKYISKSKFVRRGNEGLIQLGLGVLDNSLGLFIGDFLGNITATIYNLYILIKKLKYKIVVDFDEIKKVIRKYIDLPKFDIFPSLLNTLAISMLSFLIFSKFSLEEVGYLELAQKILLLPTAILSKSIGQILLQRVTNASHNNKSVKNELIFIIGLMTISSVAFFIIIYFFGPYLFKLIFGDIWIKSGYYAKIMIPYICIMFVISPMGRILIALQKIKINSIWQVIKFILISSLFLFKFDSVNQYIYVYTIINVFLYVLYGIIIFYNLFLFERELKK